ncbi:hypothetical protein TeGR_g7807 [Tetraparma gracilis]|uniref:Uncharacterized protein n=1 Tax=Tetraparma gracilis TaxID=2962635 RepID=A0ABQ6NEK8_9STRA|nr:hypothetical protein TeGR_g7807 [Tetraparma gracilis]
MPSLIPASLSILTLCLSAWAGAASCPDLEGMRSSLVNSSAFDPSLLKGLYYEQLYHDIAQVGASCQTLDVTDASADGLSMDFKVKYGPIPFTITELYAPGSSQGVYTKKADMPGGDLLQLPSVVVDVTEGEGGYDAFTIYSCLEIGGQAVRELVIATREPEAAKEDLESMVQVARDAGVDVDLDSLKPVKPC